MTPAPGRVPSAGREPTAGGDPASPSGRSRLRLAAGTVFGVGRAPFAPGTFGSLVAVVAVAAVFGVEGLWDGLVSHPPAPVVEGLPKPALMPVAPGGGDAVADPAVGLAGWEAYGHGMLAFGAALGVLLVAGCWVGRAARTDYGVEDPGAFVLDEVVGQGIALWPVAMQALHQQRGPPWWWLALAFVAFRVFDIAKPPPVRQAERLHGGVGIMADDVVAGLFALVVVWLAIAP